MTDSRYQGQRGESLNNKWNWTGYNGVGIISELGIQPHPYWIEVIWNFNHFKSTQPPGRSGEKDHYRHEEKEDCVRYMSTEIVCESFQEFRITLAASKFQSKIKRRIRVEEHCTKLKSRSAKKWVRFISYSLGIEAVNCAACQTRLQRIARPTPSTYSSEVKQRNQSKIQKQWKL